MFQGVAGARARFALDTLVRSPRAGRTRCTSPDALSPVSERDLRPDATAAAIHRIKARPGPGQQVRHPEQIVARVNWRAFRQHRENNARVAVRTWTAGISGRRPETRCSGSRPTSAHIASPGRWESLPPDALPSAATAALIPFA